MKVLILYNKIWHYRVPIFNIISKNVDLTVASSEAKGNEIYNFKNDGKIIRFTNLRLYDKETDSMNWHEIIRSDSNKFNDIVDNNDDSYSV